MKTSQKAGKSGYTGTLSHQECPNCGKERAEWAHPEGYTKGVLTYCCDGCGENGDCICDVEF